MENYRGKTARWYKSKRWQRERARQLARYPYCQCSLHEGQHLLANVVDHKTPHRGDPRLFWSRRNLQSLTKRCHDSWKQKQEWHELRGTIKGCNPDGTPLDHEHHWNS